MNPNITFCSVYRNEAQRLRYGLDIAKRICSSMMIVVQKSQDATKDICLEYTPNIIDRPPEPPEVSRDYVMEKVTTPWTFWLDGDEFPSLELIRFVESFNPEQYLGYDSIQVPRHNYIEGIRVEVNEGDDRQFRLLRNDVRWNAIQQGRTIHIFPMVNNSMFVDLPVFHHRSLEKVENMTNRWNDIEPKAKTVCDKYLSDVKVYLSNCKK